MKTKMIYLLLLFFSIVACSSDDNEKPELAIEDDTLIETKEYDTPVKGGALTLSLSSTVGEYPEITQNNSDWVKLKDIMRPANKGYELIFEVAPNTFVSERTAEIEIKAGKLKEKVTIVQAENVIAPDANGMESNATQLAAKITMGWNLGNTLEAIGGETNWGNPVTTEGMMKGIKNLGYNAVRLPCAWNHYLENQTTYKIKESWLNRVKEVVDYCVDNDMYVMLNIHWDEGWLENNCTPEKQESVNKKQKALWEQIAVHFRDYDERLLFAGCNEPNAKTAEQAEVLRSYEQTFIDAVRSSGGKNAYRNLIVPAPETNIELADEIMILPDDPIENRMIVEVHYYAPFNFCLMENDEWWGKMAYFWGEGYEQYAVGEYEGRWSTWGGEDYVAEQFGRMKRSFTDKGIPSFLGEFCVMRRRFDDPEIRRIHDESRGYFYEVITREAKNHGVVPFMWDTGGVFDRRDNMRVKDPEVYDGMVRGANEGRYPF